MSNSELAKQVMERIDALAKISEEPDRLTRTFCSPSMRKANDLVGSWMREAGPIYEFCSSARSYPIQPVGRGQ